MEEDKFHPVKERIDKGRTIYGWPRSGTPGCGPWSELGCGYRLGYAPGQGHSHALSHVHTHIHICTFITSGWESSPHCILKFKPFSLVFEAPPPTTPVACSWSNFCPTIFWVISECWGLPGEVWIGDLQHVSPGDSRGVNYVGVSGQCYLLAPCQVLRCWSEMCGLNRLLHCKSGHTGRVCLDSECLRVWVPVFWVLVFAGQLPTCDNVKA